MGSNSHDRDLRQAKLAYLGAVRRLDRALEMFAASEVPMDPGPGPEPRPWSAGQVAVMREVLAALGAVLDRRRAWDGLRRDWRPPH